MGISQGTGRRRLIVTGLAATGLVGSIPSRADEPVMVYAAATLRNALDAVAEDARASLHVPVTLVYGPTPSLVQGLQNGADGDIFFSADADWMNEAAARGIVDASTRVDLLSSTLVLIAPAAHSERVTIQAGSRWPLC